VSKSASLAPLVRRLVSPHGVLDPLLWDQVDVICHQVHCAGGPLSAGLAEALAKALPYADPYSCRVPDHSRPGLATKESQSTPGTIRLRSPPASESGLSRPFPVVAEFSSQLFPGSCAKDAQRKKPRKEDDSASSRFKWFQSCLDVLPSSLPKGKTRIAFPHSIGCTIAGGDWAVYEAAITAFAQANPSYTVAIVERASDVALAFNKRMERTTSEIKKASVRAREVVAKANNRVFQCVAEALISSVEDHLLSPDGSLPSTSALK